MQNTLKILRFETYRSCWGCLTTVNMQIYLKTLSPQWANSVPNLPGANYVVKNWALVMILKGSLPLAHFLSVLLLKEQMIISVKKVKHARQISTKPINNIISHKICQNIPTKLAVFYWFFFSEVSPKNSPEIGQFFCEFALKIPWNLIFFFVTYQKPWLYVFVDLMVHMQCSITFLSWSYWPIKTLH